MQVPLVGLFSSCLGVAAVVVVVVVAVSLQPAHCSARPAQTPEEVPQKLPHPAASSIFSEEPLLSTSLLSVFVLYTLLLFSMENK